MLRQRLGDILIDRIVESEEPNFDPLVFFPQTRAEDWLAHKAWMQPQALDPATGYLILTLQSFLVRTRHHTILVDTCVGDHKKRLGKITPASWHMASGGVLLDKLAAAGVAPEAVDYVMCTHLHSDHVGWNTRLVDGRWVPTFPNARYVMSRKELAHWQAVHQVHPLESLTDSVLPIVEAGRADLVQQRLRSRRSGVAGAHARTHARSLQRAPRLERRRRGHYRGSAAQSGAMSRTQLGVAGRFRRRDVQPDAPCLSRPLLRHGHAGLWHALSVTVLRPCAAARRRLRFRVRGRIACRLSDPTRAEHGRATYRRRTLREPAGLPLGAALCADRRPAHALRRRGPARCAGHRAVPARPAELGLPVPQDDPGVHGGGPARGGAGLVRLRPLRQARGRRLVQLRAASQLDAATSSVSSTCATCCWWCRTGAACSA